MSSPSCDARLCCEAGAEGPRLCCEAGAEGARLCCEAGALYYVSVCARRAVPLALVHCNLVVLPLRSTAGHDFTEMNEFVLDVVLAARASQPPGERSGPQDAEHDWLGH